MAKKNGNGNIEEKPRIPVSEIVVGGAYKTYVNDIVKILRINEETETITLYNVTGSFKQWTSFKNIYLVKRIK